MNIVMKGYFNKINAVGEREEKDIKTIATCTNY